MKTHPLLSRPRIGTIFLVVLLVLAAASATGYANQTGGDGGTNPKEQRLTKRATSPSTPPPL